MKKIAVLILYLIPVALLIGFVAAFSVNVPFWDQWRLVPLFDKVATGTVTFGDFWALHSNHRIVFPKLIITALAFVSHWNINYELCLSIFLAILIFIYIYKISLFTANNSSDRLFHLTNILTALLLFSLVQNQNWLWGFQIAWFLVNLGVISAVYWLNCDRRLSPNTRFILATVSCFVASFSSAHGLLSWLAVIPSLLVLDEKISDKIKRVVVWLSIFASLSIIYAIDYHPQNRHPKIGSLLEHPLVGINYFFSLLASPIVRFKLISAIIGLGILAVFISFVVYFYRKNKFNLLTINSEVSPWVSIGLFSILCSISITAGRVSYGVEQALNSSRYTTTSILLAIALIQLWQLFIRKYKDRTKVIYQKIYIGFGVFLAATITVNSGLAIAQAQAALPYKQSMKTCLELINYIEKSPFHQSTDSCLSLLSTKTWLVREGAEILGRINFRHFPKDITFIADSTEDYGYIDTPDTDRKPLILKTSDSLLMSGWAIFPDRLQPPTIVLLSYGNKRSFFANAYVTLDSPDVAKAFNSNRYSRVRWAVTIAANSLPIGENEINAWVYNQDGKQFIKLKGDPKVIVKE